MVPAHIPAPQVNCVPNKRAGWRVGLLAAAMVIGGVANLQADPSEEIFAPATPVNVPTGMLSGWDPFSETAGSGNYPLLVYFANASTMQLLKGPLHFPNNVAWVGSGYVATALEVGQTIDASLSWTSTGNAALTVAPDPLMDVGESLYFGYRLVSQSDPDDVTYGWVQFENIAGGYYLSRWAYNSGDGEITIPLDVAIPEPGTYAAILGGVALGGAWMMRRRKQASAEASA